MLKKLFGPKHTFKDALLILEKGLWSGEITLNGEEDADRLPIVERASFQRSLRVRIFAPLVSYANVRWSGRSTFSDAS